MPKPIPAPTRELNRLRAAAALVPIIETGLAESKISTERACLMAAFCESATQLSAFNPEELKLAKTVLTGLQRIKTVLSAAA